MQSPMGVHFIDTTRDRRHSFSVDSAIWDVPLVKPRFGCSIDLDLSVQGYDVAHQLGKHVEAFRNGERCERGVIEVDQATLELKNEWEFPLGYPTSRMPPLGGFRISVMYRTFSGDMELVNASISTAIRCLPEALEIVVVVEEVDKDLAEEMLVFHRKSAPFPLRVVAEPSLMDGHIQQKYSKVSQDMYHACDDLPLGVCQCSGRSIFQIRRATAKHVLVRIQRFKNNLSCKKGVEDDSTSE